MPVGPKSSDWLFLLYMDGDDPTINDSLFVNMRYAESSLAMMRNPDGSVKEGYPSINIVAMWDGVSEGKKGDSKCIHPDAALYELGADYQLLNIEINTQEEYDAVFGKWQLAANTKDLTFTARDWLVKEPDMGDPKTLEGFLKWAKAMYKSENVVLCLNDHGAGPHKETYYEATANSKSVCSDNTNYEATKKRHLLSCKGVKDALSAAGYTGADKPKILWNDLCLQAAAEILYNWAGCAEYLSASPNLSVSNDWTAIFPNMKKDSTALDVGKLIVTAYYKTHHDREGGVAYHQNEENAKDYRSSGYSMYTWSLFSLDQQKAAALKSAVDNFAAALLAIKESDSGLFNSIYTNYIAQDMNDLTKCKGLAYPGSFAYLNDLGWLAKEVKADNALSAAHPAAQELLDLLKHGDNNLIAYAWGGKRASGESASGWTGVTKNSMYLTGQKVFQSDETVAVECSEDVYGLTIVGSSRYGYPKGSSTPRPVSSNGNAVMNYYDWTKFSEAWGTVINDWMKWAYKL